MSDSTLSLARPPIVEAVVEIDCDMSPALDLAALEQRVGPRLGDSYPNARRQITPFYEYVRQADQPPAMSIQHGAAVQFSSSDGKQIVQVRPEGYSFNRLAPYAGLDGYLPEIERTWHIVREETGAVLIRRVVLRFINLLLLPPDEGPAELAGYLTISPRLPDTSLEFIGFLNQQSAVETGTGNRVNMTLNTQAPEDDRLPLIFDIDAWNADSRPAEDWEATRKAILSLRALKNRVFQKTLTEKCLNLFR